MCQTGLAGRAIEGSPIPVLPHESTERIIQLEYLTKNMEMNNRPPGIICTAIGIRHCAEELFGKCSAVP